MSEHQAISMCAKISKWPAANAMMDLLVEQPASLVNSDARIPVDFFLQEVMLECLNFRIIARLFEVATVANPIDAGLWARETMRSLTDGHVSGISTEYAQGVVLGLMKSGAWLAGWKEGTCFEQFLPQGLPGLLFSDCLAGHTLADEDIKPFGGSLAEPATKWVHGHEDRSLSHSARLWKMVDKFGEKIARHGSSPLGNVNGIVLEKLSFAIFGILGGFAQMHALALWREHQEALE